MAEQYTSIKTILDKTLRHPMMKDLSFETAIDYCIDFMRIVGCPNMFEEKVIISKIEDYRSDLPEDYYTMIQIRDNKSKVAFRYATNSFHLGEHPESFDLTYKVQNHKIYYSIKEGEVEIAYNAIMVDDCGYPMIPDNSSFTRALELYIKKQWFTILFDMGKLQNGILQNVQQEYAWAVGDCQSEFNRMSLDQAEAFFNSWNRMRINTMEHSTGFVNTGSKEFIKRH